MTQCMCQYTANASAAISQAAQRQNDPDVVPQAVSVYNSGSQGLGTHLLQSTLRARRMHYVHMMDRRAYSWTTFDPTRDGS